MNEHEIAKKITTYLDRGTAELKAGTAFKLQRARQRALSQLAERTQPELALAGGGTFGARRVLADARLWQQRDIEETDAAILASDLPIEAYLDQGFQAWLKHSEP